MPGWVWLILGTLLGGAIAYVGILWYLSRGLRR